MPPLVISIQSQVVHGHVGNSAAAFPMRALGVDVAEVPTTLLSNHPRYPTTRGRVLDAGLVADLLAGVEERGLPARAAVLLTGYLGSAAIADAVADFADRARRANPALTWICDPVMGDADIGFFVPHDLRARFAERLVPMADIVTPNAFELAALAGVPVGRAEDVASAAARLAPPTIVATSVPCADPATVATVLAAAGSAWTIPTPRLDARPAGTGDLLAGLLAARLATGAAPLAALKAAVAGAHAALARTPAAPWQEMPIVAAIAEITAPSVRFRAERVVVPGPVPG